MKNTPRKIALFLIPLILLSGCGRMELQQIYDATQTAASALSATQTVFNPNLPLAATITPEIPTEALFSPTPLNHCLLTQH